VGRRTITGGAQQAHSPFPRSAQTSTACSTTEFSANGLLSNLVAGLHGLGDNVDSLMYWDAGHGANDDPEKLLAWANTVTGHSS
jgi:hypothetical protein